MNKLLPIAFTTVLLVGCSTDKKPTIDVPELSKLQITFKEGGDDQLIDWSGLVKNDTMPCRESHWWKDKKSGLWTRSWDSLDMESGNYSFRCRSITGKEKVVPITKTNFQRIVTDLDLGYQKVDSLSAEDVLNAQSLELVYFGQGCASPRIERFHLSRNPFTTEYTLAYGSNYDGRNIGDPEIVMEANHFTALELFGVMSATLDKKAQQLEEFRKKQYWYLAELGLAVEPGVSTVRVALYLIADGKYVEYDDHSGESVTEFYDVFKAKAISLKDRKLLANQDYF